jgi:hypothetical protein
MMIYSLKTSKSKGLDGHHFVIILSSKLNNDTNWC